MNFTKTQNTLPETDQWLTYSKAENLPYKIFISHPKEPAPRSGYPVVYVLDGNAFFQLFQETVRMQSKRSEKTGILSSIIVGVGYPVEEDFVSDRRFYDFTPPHASELPPRPHGGEWPNTGGADFFLDFIETELKPLMQKNYAIDPNQQSLFGHSLGGLFTLYVAFNQPHAFQTYIASSPSIWWNNQAILEDEAKFISGLESHSGDIGLFLSVGSMEKEHMVQDARALSERLMQLSHHPLRTVFHEAEGENHLSVVPTTLSRALRFVFR